MIDKINRRAGPRLSLTPILAILCALALLALLAG
jgi:hypothetical protein